jgi:GDPmannose 4,6-dehydratase
MKKVLITGITGQDGSYMTDFLLGSTNFEIFGMVRRSSKPDYSNLKLSLKNPRFKMVVGDLSDSQSIENLVREINPDYFINLAAQSFVGSSWQIPEQTFDVTALGVLRCLEAIRKFAPNCRFYSAGSSEEMGDVLYSPQDLNHPIRPRSPYGAAKAAARHLTKVYRDSYNLYALHSILYNHESERRGEEFVTRKISKGVARIHKSIKNNKDFSPIELGNLDSKRDWSHAKDFIKGIWMMLNQEEPKEYILSSNETHSIREFVEKAFKVADLEGVWHGNGPSEEFSLPPYLMEKKNISSSVLVKINPEFYRPAEVSLLHGDSSLARKELGWQPEISFDKLVELMLLSDIDEAQKSQE